MYAYVEGLQTQLTSCVEEEEEEEGGEEEAAHHQTPFPEHLIMSANKPHETATTNSKSPDAKREVVSFL